jgi:integrase
MSFPPKTIYSVTEGLGSPQTRKKYAYDFNCFLKHFDIKSQEQLLDLKDPRYIEGMIIKYIKYLSSERNLVYATIHHRVAAIVHFFDMNDVLLNKRKINKFIPPNENSHEDRPYTTGEIQRILDHCDERGRVIFLLMSSTGMRIGAIDGIRFGDLTEISEYKLYKITVYATSKCGRYYTFCTPECANAINEYRKYRERYGEIITKDSQLIRDNFDTSLHYHCEHPERMSDKGINSIVDRIVARSGVANDEVMRSHGLRKRYVTILKNCKVDYSDREYLVGHKHSRGLDISYDRSTVDERLGEYCKAIDSLSINQEFRLKSKIQELETQRSQEYDILKKEMEEIRQLLASHN